MKASHLRIIDHAYIIIINIQGWIIIQKNIFTSRSLHTICSRDWSSDVCSSDLPVLLFGGAHHATRALALHACVLRQGALHYSDALAIRLSGEAVQSLTDRKSVV